MKGGNFMEKLIYDSPVAKTVVLADAVSASADKDNKFIQFFG